MDSAFFRTLSSESSGRLRAVQDESIVSALSIDSFAAFAQHAI